MIKFFSGREAPGPKEGKPYSDEEARRLEEVMKTVKAPEEIIKYRKKTRPAPQPELPPLSIGDTPTEVKDGSGLDIGLSEYPELNDFFKVYPESEFRRDEYSEQLIEKIESGALLLEDAEEKLSGLIRQYNELRNAANSILAREFIPSVIDVLTAQTEEPTLIVNAPIYDDLSHDRIGQKIIVRFSRLIAPLQNYDKAIAEIRARRALVEKTNFGA
ncbi:MAG: hypothetical protein ABIA47_01120 [bacterium]